MIGLVDCNNFFVSCERAVNPSLEGRPVVVLSNNDGCVVARSNESKRMGIKMGQPAFEIRNLIESGQIIALSGNHLLYREKSLRVHDIIRKYAPATIDYSVDESFIDLRGIPISELPLICSELYRTIWKEEHIPVTVGVALTKTLAKIATHKGKHNAQNVVIVPSVEEFNSIFETTPIGELWGIGRRISKQMYLLGVHTIADFVRKDLFWVRSKFGVVGERSWRELRGESCIELAHVKRTLQDSISETRTFPEDTNDYDYLRSRIAIYCAHVSKRLRAMGGQCAELTVFLRTNRFRTQSGYYAPQISVTFDPPVWDTAVITSAAVACLDKIFNPQFSYKRAGVVLDKITPLRTIAPSLFDDVEECNREFLKSQKLMKAIDALNQGPGAHTVKLASQLCKGKTGTNDGYSVSFGPPPAT